MIESLRTTQITFFRFATPSGFLGGGDEVQTYSCNGSCKGKSCETICENIVSRYQTLVSSLPPGGLFFTQTTEKRIYDGAAQAAQ